MKLSEQDSRLVGPTVLVWKRSYLMLLLSLMLPSFETKKTIFVLSHMAQKAYWLVILDNVTSYLSSAKLELQ